MIFPLHLLLVADEPAAPVLAALRRAGYDPRPHHVTTATAAGLALEQRAWDAVLVGPGVPTASVWDVLGWLERYDDSPPLFVVVEDALDADVVALLEGGARDVVGMTHINRLGVSMARAMRNIRALPAAPPERPDASDSAFYALAEHMPVGLYRSTEDGRILYANPALAQILGYESVEDLLGEAIVERARYPREEFQRRIEADGEVRGFEMQWERADGQKVVTCENARAVRDAHGALLYYEGTMEDVTEERRALETERHRVEQLEALVRFSTAVDEARSSEALYGAVVRVIEETMRGDAAVLLGQSDGEFDIRAWSKNIPYEEVQVCRTQQVWATYPLEATPLLVRDERAVTGPNLVAPLRAFMRRAGLRALGSFPLLHRGRLLGALVVFYQKPHTFSEGALRMAETLAWHVAGAISRWQAEAELRDSETTLRTITDTTGHVPYRLRFGADTYDHLSPSIERITGYSPEALQAAGGLDALTETYRGIEGEALKGGQADAASHYLAFHHLRTAKGELRWIEDNAYPWVDESGHTVGLVGVLQDVTERHKRETAAREQTQRSLAQQRALNELAALDADTDTVLQRATAAAAATTGTGRVGLWLLDEGAGKIRCHHLTLHDGQRRSDSSAISVKACADALSAHRVVVAPDLDVCPLDPALGLDAHTEAGGVRAVLIAPIRRQSRVVGFVTFEHVGTPRTWTLDEQDFAAAVADLAALVLEQQQRAQAEAALRESERRYRAISTLGTDCAHAVRIEPDGTTRLEWATDAFGRITGYAPDEISGVADLVALVHEDHRAEAESKIRRLAVGQTIEVELRIVTKSGEERWICHRSRPVRDEQGRLRCVYSTGQDVTDRKRFEEALIAAREHAEELARNKSTFLANMSHEIRTPLTGIIGFAGVLGEEVGEEHREFAHLIKRSGRRLLETINSVLDLAQLESEGLEPAPEPLDLTEEARQAVLLLSPLAEEKGLALNLHAEDDPVMVSADPTCLHRVFNNIVGNAIKFTEQGEVTVTVRTEGERARIEVRDTGVGIDAEFLPHLFNEFRQEVKKSDREGSGLGLAITKKLVEFMDGTVSVESAKGEGSAFTITFPLIVTAAHTPKKSARPAETEDTPSESVPETVEAARPAEQSTAKPSKKKAPGDAANARSDDEAEGHPDHPEDKAMLASILSHVDWPEPKSGDGETDEPVLSLFNEQLAAAIQQADDEDDDTVSGDGPGARQSGTPENTNRVLVVTDNATSRDRIVRGAGGVWAVETVVEARAVLNRMAQEQYAALVIDVNVGGKQTGANVLRVVRALPGYGKVFAVALTAAKEERDYAAKAGFNCCLQEPFTNTALLDALRPALSSEASAK